LVCCCRLLGQGRHGTSFNSAAPESDVFLMGAPIIGGLLDSVIGIITGTLYGILPQLGALLGPLLPGPAL
jgi:hypothetical protein